MLAAVRTDRERLLLMLPAGKDPKTTVVEHEMTLLRYHTQPLMPDTSSRLRSIPSNVKEVAGLRQLKHVCCCHWNLDDGCSVLQFHLIVFHPYRPLRSFLSQYQVPAQLSQQRC
jgi:hypothetical protein